MTDVTPIYRQHSPVVDAIPVVVSMPHSGMHAPSEIGQLFTAQQRNWLRNTDWYLPQLYDFLVGLGVTVIEATHSRYVVDLNRDPAGDLFGEFRSAVIAKENDHGDAVYAIAPSQQSLMQRLARYHAPYHNTLDEVLNAVAERFGSVLLLDLHSFMGPIDNDVCLGDRGGISCAPEIAARDFFLLTLCCYALRSCSRPSRDRSRQSAYLLQ
ncbi:N-formylglutamate amidohydrolase [Undibacterium arcticum]